MIDSVNIYGCTLSLAASGGASGTTYSGITITGIPTVEVATRETTQHSDTVKSKRPGRLVDNGQVTFTQLLASASANPVPTTPSGFGSGTGLAWAITSPSDVGGSGFAMSGTGFVKSVGVNVGSETEDMSRAYVIEVNTLA